MASRRLIHKPFKPEVENCGHQLGLKSQDHQSSPGNFLSRQLRCLTDKGNHARKKLKKKLL